MTLTFVNGPHAGRSLVLVERAPRTLGAGAAADVTLHDPALSPVHLAVWRDGGALLVRDLDSQTGTFVNDLPVREAALRVGDRVQIGGSLLVVSAVAAEPISAAAPARPLESLLAWHRVAPRDLVRWALLGEPGALYALVDVARDPDLLDILDETGEEFCAFDETHERDDLGATAPVLVAITPGAPTLATLIEEVWSLGGAVFFASDAPFREVYRHLLARAGVDPAQTALRFWDPEALRARLDAPDVDGHRALYGPIRAFLIEAPGGAAVLRYARVDGVVERTVVALS